MNVKNQTHRTGLMWFSNDLRLHDNAALQQAAENCASLLCVYVVNPAWFMPNKYNMVSINHHRWEFLYDALQVLNQELAAYGQRLVIAYETPADAITRFITKLDIDAVFKSENAGFDERLQWQVLKDQHPDVGFFEHPTHTLFDRNSLPFELGNLPNTFSQFRKAMRSVTYRPELVAVDRLPSPVDINANWSGLPPKSSSQSRFRGGVLVGEEQLNRYFSNDLPSYYKEVRNALAGWANSTKLSPWLANGNISARNVITRLRNYESRKGKNESTKHLEFELLWREYFQWYAHAYGIRLFSRSGISGRNLLTSFYSERFKRWCQGTTPFPLVNACMRELTATGYITNRGRQITASCLVNELAIDWRYGAAWFELQLIDYDVASNWGNWQYIAGVGADPRGGRHFDIEKQTHIYDPKKEYIKRWVGDEPSITLDSVDAADWPIL